MVTIVREFDAPPAKVFRAHTDPDLFLRWNGPDSLDTRLDRFDCTTGGGYSYAMTRGDETYAFHGCFHDVVPSELIVQTFTFDGQPESVALEKLHFEDLGDGRTRLVATSLVDSFEDRDAFVASGLETGVVEGYNKLDALLADLPD